METSVRIECITTEQEFLSFRSEWNALVELSAADTVFLTWEWLTSWWSAYGSGKKLRILVARDQTGACQGIAPLYVVRSGRARLLRFLGDGTYDSDYLDFIVVRGREAEIVAAFIEALNGMRGTWDAMQLNEMPDTSASLPLLRNLKEELNWLARQEEVPCGVRTLPDTWEGFLQTLKPRFRTSARASLRNLEQWNGGFEVLTARTEISDWLEELFTLHSGRWALRQQAGVFGKDGKKKFYEQMSESFFERGWLHMTRWCVNGIALAYQFGFVYRGTYHLLQEGFDTRCIHIGPGVTLRAATIRDLIQRGVHTYDFLGGIGRHKTDWGAIEKKSVRLALAPKSAAGYAYVRVPELVQGAKDRIKRIVPEGALQRWKGTLSHEAVGEAVAPPASSVASPVDHSWKADLAGVLYKTNMLRAVEAVSKRYELGHQQGSFPFRFRSASHPKVAILCYHRVGTEGVPLYSNLPPEVFEAQMEFLSNRYRVIPLDSLVEELQDRHKAKQAVVVTFDDGYRDLYAHALPVLQKYRVPATVYLTADAIERNQIAWYDRIFLALNVAPGEKLDVMLDRPRRFLLSNSTVRMNAAVEIISYLRTVPDKLRREFCSQFEVQIPLPAEQVANRMLTWDQIRKMRQAGIAFGSHTLCHPAISKLEPDALAEELRGSKALIEERINVQVNDFAYPFGKMPDYEGTQNAMASCGYRTAVTTNWGLNVPGTDLLGLRRVSIGEERKLSIFAMKLAQLFLSSENQPKADVVALVTAKKASSTAQS